MKLRPKVTEHFAGLRSVIAAVAAAMVICVALGACGSSSISSSDKTKLLNGCTAGGNAKSECQCLVNYLAKHYTVSEFNSAVTAYNKTGKEPSDVLKAAKACVS